MLKAAILAGWPPDGWIFYQPETNWWAPNPLQFTFKQQVQNIIDMRLANPRFNLPTDRLAVAQELMAYTERRLNFDPRFSMSGSAPGSLTIAQKKTSRARWTRPNAAAVAVAEDALADPAALVDWLGAGGRAVASEQAEARAAVCAGCPENSHSPTCAPSRRLSWRSWMTVPVATSIRTLLSLRNLRKLSTSRDRELGKCLACRCELKLKVFTPIHHLLEKAKPEDLVALDPGCWVLKERDQER